MVLGQTGQNFAAGMSGGVAYVLDMQETFGQHIRDARNSQKSPNRARGVTKNGFKLKV